MSSLGRRKIFLFDSGASRCLTVDRRVTTMLVRQLREESRVRGVVGVRRVLAFFASPQLGNEFC